MLYAADYTFWRQYLPQIRERFTGELWSVSEQARDQYGTYWIRHATDEGLAREPDTINGGGNSGYQAVHLAATFGAARIILLGFDMQRTGGKIHWHGPHEGRLPNGVGFPAWLKAFGPLAKDLKAAGIEVVNCSRTTAMTCFPRQRLEDALL